MLCEYFYRIINPQLLFYCGPFPPVYIMRITSPLLALSSTAMGLTVTAIALAVVILASNFTIINAQQSLTGQQPGEIESGTTTGATAPTRTFQSTNDSFSIQVPQGWVIQDANNTGSALLEETTKGYGMLAELCPEQPRQQQQGAQPTNDGGSTNSSVGTSGCQGSEEVIYIIRYPDLDTRIRVANNITAGNNNITTDDILSYHLKKLQEVGYRSIQTINSTEVRLNLTNPQTSETIATMPAKVVEIAYSTNSDPNEIRRGYFILTATTGTPPNLGTTKGYAVFYEGNSTTRSAAAEIATVTAASSSLAPTPLPPPVVQAFDSFELVAAPEIAQTIAQDAQAAPPAESGDEGSNDNSNNDNNDDDNNDDNGGSNDNNDDDNNDDNGGSNDNGGGGDDDGADGGNDNGADGESPGEQTDEEQSREQTQANAESSRGQDRVLDDCC